MCLSVLSLNSFRFYIYLYNVIISYIDIDIYIYTYAELQLQSLVPIQRGSLDTALETEVGLQEVLRAYAQNFRPHKT